MLNNIKLRLKHLRVIFFGKGQTRKKMAAFLKIHPGIWLKWESGKVIPNTDKLADVAQKTGCSLDWLILGIGNPPSPPIQPPEIDDEVTEKDDKQNAEDDLFNIIDTKDNISIRGHLICICPNCGTKVFADKGKGKIAEDIKND